ncbi:MAG TPA: MCP four helix bundle domain-containing protein, partial [Gemmatimonadaceae bacterium]|nr:MCP four helix bundle domain-containing protein [Gemmatimonadaceae bacterium]
MFKNLRLGAKLMGGFLAVTALALLLGTVSLVGIGRVRDKAESVAENNFPSLMGLGLLNVGISDMRRIELGLSAATRSANGRWRAAIRAEWDSVQVKELKRGRELYEPLARTAEEDKLWQEYNAAFKTYEAHFEAMQQALLAGDIAAADTLAGAGLPKFQAANRPLMALVDLTDKYVTTNAAALTGEARLARILTWVGSALALVLGVILAISLTRAIVRPLSEVVERTERLREADLANLEQGLVALSRGDVSVTVESTTASLHTTRQDEIGDLARTVDGMIAQTRASVVGYGRVQQTLGRLVSETGALTTAARMGRLEARGATDGFEGTYEQLVAAVNDTLDAVLAPVKETSAALERLAERDLTIRVTGEYVGEHATIKNAFNTAVSNLENALAQVASASQQVAAAGSQITSASTSLAGDANEQASSLEEVSSSLHEIAATVQHTAENSSTVQAMMQLVGKEMGGVTESMERLTGAVNEIESGAQRTAKIVKTIDEIAFQTNL